MKKINEINTLEDFAKYLGIRTQLLTYLLYGKNNDELYTMFTVPKKSGGTREIHAPIKPLKNIQKRLAQKIKEHIDYTEEDNKIVNKISHGFVKNKSIITNAKVHRNKRYVLNIDLENFFPTIHFGRVRGFFIKNKRFKLEPQIATIIAQLTCHDGSLPQGAPTSPIISNLIANILDINILKLTKKYNLNYTRYVDDLTFSTNEKEFYYTDEKFILELKDVINKSGFKINESKSRTQYYSSRQTVTGLTVNKKINTKKEFHKNTRAMANNLYSKGCFYIDSKEGTLEQLNGRFSFINQLDWYNNMNKEKEHDERIKYLDLNSREKEYQKFIFYKNFIKNDKPLLITEGKTDINYLKGALKKNYRAYPNLIKKKGENKYNYNVSFLYRFQTSSKGKKNQNKWLYFFNIENDGAGPLDKIIDLYIGSNKNADKFCGYWDFFKEKKITPTNPVIIILDNDEELRKFKNKVYGRIFNYKNRNNYWKKYLKGEEFKKHKKEYKNKIKSELKQNNHVELFENIYLLTLPKKDEKTDVEMEDLFDSKTINDFNTMNYDENKELKKIKEKDKNRFSNYVLKRYENISYDGFNPTLKDLNKIKESYDSKKSCK